MNGRFPNLLVIGAMKAGTSSLHEYLQQHPAIFMSNPKEVHYYADGNKMSLEEYQNLFQTDKKVAGTSPQSYTKCHNKYYQHIPERIFKDTPAVKMIYIVRDPIERYKSHVLESFHCDPLHDIEYNKKSGHYWKTSSYALQLKAYLEYFELSQIYILSLEELNAQPLVEMNKIFSFLGLESMQDESLFQTKKNTAATKSIPNFIRKKLLFRIVRKMARKPTEKIVQQMALKSFQKEMKKPQLSPAELEELKQKLIPDIEEFRKITGKEFPKWNL